MASHYDVQDNEVSSEVKGPLVFGKDVTNGIYHPLAVNATGQVITVGASGVAVDIADDTAANFVVGTGRVVPAAFLFDDASTDTIAEDRAGIARIDGSRRQLIRIVGSTDANRLQVDANGEIGITELPTAGQITADGRTAPSASELYVYLMSKDVGANTFSRVSSEVANLNTDGDTSDRGLHVSDVVKYFKVVLTALNVEYDTSTTETNSSASQDCTRFREFLFMWTVTKNNTPTDIQAKVQFSDDGGTTWFDYRNDFWGQLIYDDVAVGSGFNRCYSGRCIGDLMRVQVVATGLTGSGGANNNFTVDNATLILKN